MNSYDHYTNVWVIPLCYISMFCYFITIIFGFHNIIAYVIKQERYKYQGGVLIALFYLFGVTNLILRLTMYFVEIIGKNYL